MLKCRGVRAVCIPGMWQGLRMGAVLVADSFLRIFYKGGRRLMAKIKG